MEHFFKLKEHGTDVRTEIIAGVTTFMTMAYILAVNPATVSYTHLDVYKRQDQTPSSGHRYPSRLFRYH